MIKQLQGRHAELLFETDHSYRMIEKTSIDHQQVMEFKSEKSVGFDLDYLGRVGLFTSAEHVPGRTTHLRGGVFLGEGSGNIDMSITRPRALKRLVYGAAGKHAPYTARIDAVILK